MIKYENNHNPGSPAISSNVYERGKTFKVINKNPGN